jgi:hypothetical protein
LDWGWVNEYHSNSNLGRGRKEEWTRNWEIPELVQFKLFFPGPVSSLLPFLSQLERAGEERETVDKGMKVGLVIDNS